jgi:hypothetical protein
MENSKAGGMKINPARLRELCAKGLNAQQIGTRLNVTPGAVHLYCKRHGIAVAAAKRIDCLADSLGRNA